MFSRHAEPRPLCGAHGLWTLLSITALAYIGPCSIRASAAPGNIAMAARDTWLAKLHLLVALELAALENIALRCTGPCGCLKLLLFAASELLGTRKCQTSIAWEPQGAQKCRTVAASKPRGAGKCGGDSDSAALEPFGLQTLDLKGRSKRPPL